MPVSLAMGSDVEEEATLTTRREKAAKRSPKAESGTAEHVERAGEETMTEVACL